MMCIVWFTWVTKTLGVVFTLCAHPRLYFNADYCRLQGEAACLWYAEKCFFKSTPRLLNTKSSKNLPGITLNFCPCSSWDFPKGSNSSAVQSSYFILLFFCLYCVLHPLFSFVLEISAAVLCIPFQTTPFWDLYCHPGCLLYLQAIMLTFLLVWPKSDPHMVIIA